MSYLLWVTYQVEGAGLQVEGAGLQVEGVELHRGPDSSHPVPVGAVGSSHPVPVGVGHSHPVEEDDSCPV